MSYLGRSGKSSMKSMAAHDSIQPVRAEHNNPAGTNHKRHGASSHRSLPHVQEQNQMTLKAGPTPTEPLWVRSSNNSAFVS